MEPEYWLYAGTALLAVFALAAFTGGLGHLARRRIVRGGVRCTFGLVLGLAAAVALLAGLNLLSWHRFNAEQAVGEISFVQLGPQDYRVDLSLADGRFRQFELRGDEWQLDARVLKWKSVATLIGFDPLYRVDRISGRYDSVRETRQQPPSVAALSQPRGLDLWSLAHSKAAWLPFIDASYGSATYLPMADGARYRITISNTGLLARPANEAARRTVKAWL